MSSPYTCISFLGVNLLSHNNFCFLRKYVYITNKHYGIHQYEDSAPQIAFAKIYCLILMLCTFYEVVIPAGTCQTLKGFAHKIKSYIHNNIHKYGYTIHCFRSCKWYSTNSDLIYLIKIVSFEIVIMILQRIFEIYSYKHEYHIINIIASILTQLFLNANYKANKEI